MRVDFLLRGLSEGSSVVFRIGQDDRYVVGRSTDCDLIIDDRSVSRSHAELRPVPGGIEVRDLDSRNGTFIDGKRVKSACVASGQRLSFGRVCFVVLLPADGEG